MIRRLLNSCEYLDTRPGVPSKIQIPLGIQPAFYWKESINFKEGKILSIVDSAVFDHDGSMVERAFYYDFRTKNSAGPIFRICNHNSAQPVTNPAMFMWGAMTIVLSASIIREDSPQRTG
jgi:hypothetical protein